jgi:exonuclease III
MWNNLNLMATTPQSLPATYCSEEDDTQHIGTWNVNGGNDANKRELIDGMLKADQMLIACLQEVRVPTGSLEAENYIWYCVCDEKRNGGGAAVAGREVIEITRNHGISDNSIALVTEVLGVKTRIISCYIPPDDRRKREYEQLMDYMHKTDDSVVWKQ